MATSLPAIANLTGAAVTEAGFKTELTNLLAALREGGDPLGAYGRIQNLSIKFAVAANALTATVTQRDASSRCPPVDATAARSSANAPSGRSDAGVASGAGIESLPLRCGRLSRVPTQE